ncbi:STAS domain-containing protein [Amycolatopsis sp. 195334CR]|uniref:STAS domain-containing protein n=1 Tax=Amycolatopsis sp. 195334CR TaxID=2814588 RepID=UPI001A9067D8|nr:STAS domain-containing protein [Amycolatopsis sp. 195334CR]MBN6037223.1 STAS domain-containing protein [Amycolatopsis sp. 195334CR]
MMPSGVCTAEEGLTIAVAWHGEVVELAVTGELDTTTAAMLAEAIAQAVADGPAALVVNLSGVEFLASAGISVLIEANATLRIPFALVAATHQVRRPLAVTGLDRILPLYPTATAALACA